MKLVFCICLLSICAVGFASERLFQTSGQNYSLLDDDPYKSEEAEQMRAMMRDELVKFFATDLQYEGCQITLQQYPRYTPSDQAAIDDGFYRSAARNAGYYKVVIDAPGEVSETIDADARTWTLRVSGGFAPEKYLPVHQELRLSDDSATLKLTDYRAIRKRKLPSLIPCIPLMGNTCPTHKTVGYIERTLTLTVEQSEVTAFSMTDKHYRRVLTGYLPYKEKSLTCKE